jgi:arylsulfatase A-like enzyme
MTCAPFRATFALLVLFAVAAQSALAKPNIVVIFCDDMGYGDIGAFGHPTIQTPNLDRMAAEGQKWTSFYAAAPVCTPSRAALMTGRLPIRSGMCNDTRRVLFPDSSGGIPAEEVLLPELLKAQGYATACVGKWHLGHLPQYLPTRNGFDYYYGIPYSNDMDRDQAVPHAEAFGNPKSEYFNVPLMRNEEIIERPADQTTITKRYTDESVTYIKANKDKPFFLYLAHNLPHIPLFRSTEFEGKSRRGLYGDVIEEIDWSVGQVLDTLRAEGIADNTLVLFTSDNGPWIKYELQGGSAGLLRGGKGGTFEGGMRVPAIFWQPGTIAPGVIAEMGSTLDVLATAAALAGATLPADRALDSVDLGPALHATGASPRTSMIYYRDTTPYALRQGPFKAHFQTREEYGDATVTQHDPPLLYNVEQDPGEQFDVSKEHPEVIAAIRADLEAHIAAMVPGANQLAGKITN